MTEQYEVVHCKTKEEWDLVTKILKYEWNSKGYFKRYNRISKGACINVNKVKHGTLDFYTRNNAIIYTFKEWNTLNSKLNTKDDLSYLTEFLIKNEIT